MISGPMVRGMIGYAHEFGSNENEVSGSFLVFRQISDSFGAGLELAGGAPLHRFEEKSIRLNIGFKWEVAMILNSQRALAARLLAARRGRETKAAIYLERAL